MQACFFVYVCVYVLWGACVNVHINACVKLYVCDVCMCACTYVRVICMGFTVTTPPPCVSTRTSGDHSPREPYREGSVPLFCEYIHSCPPPLGIQRGQKFLLLLRYHECQESTFKRGLCTVPKGTSLAADGVSLRK